jgi:lipopolysaccharide transport system ATP-binding protein
MEEVWALKDVSFEIRRGEAVGIYGRIASLLEVGTGFHSELSGRENTYLNGTILWMSRYRMQWETDNSNKNMLPT